MQTVVQTYQRSYTDLNLVYPKDQIESENYSISRIEMSRDRCMMEMMQGARHYWTVRGLKSNFEYVRLYKKGEGVMMSDTPMERNSNREFISRANGDVLIFGLGLGLVIIPLLEDDSVKSITVVELYQDLIDLVLPILKPLDNKNKLRAVQGDAFNYELAKGSKFDSIYFDIWLNITSDDYEQHKQLKKQYRKYVNKANPNSFIDCWLNSYYRKDVAKEKRQEKAGRWGW